MKVIVTNKERGNKIEYNNVTSIIDNSPTDFKLEYYGSPLCHYFYNLYDWDIVKEEPHLTLSDVVDYIDGLIKETEMNKSNTVDNVEIKYLKILADYVRH